MSKKDGALRAWTGAVPEELLVLIEEAHGDILSHWTLDTGAGAGASTGAVPNHVAEIRSLAKSCVDRFWAPPLRVDRGARSTRDRWAIQACPAGVRETTRRCSRRDEWIAQSGFRWMRSRMYSSNNSSPGRPARVIYRMQATGRM